MKKCKEMESMHANGHINLKGYVALDVIPGGPGETPTEADVLKSINMSINNLNEMTRNGLRPWPVYHEGEDISILDYYVQSGHDIIAVAGTVSRGNPSRLSKFLTPIFNKYPRQRFHGLAMTSPSLMAKFPFESVDSTTWLNFCKFGMRSNVYLLRNRTDEFWKKIGIDCPPKNDQEIAACVSWIEDMGLPTKRLAGILAMLDLPKASTWNSKG